MDIMRAITTKKGQTIFDIALQEYGNAEAAFQILADNPRLAGLNDFPVGYVVQQESDFDVSHAIKPGVEILIQDYIEIENTLIANELTEVIS